MVIKNSHSMHQNSFTNIIENDIWKGLGYCVSEILQIISQLYFLLQGQIWNSLQTAINLVGDFANFL